MSWASLFSQASGRGNMEVEVNRQASAPSSAATSMSALDSLNEYGKNPISFEDYYHKYGYGSNNPYSLAGRLQDWFSGNVSSARQAYSNYLEMFYNTKANKETWAREDSEIQRLFDQYSRVGVNPYLMINSGGVSSATSSQASKAKRDKVEKAKEDNILSTALKVLALILFKKA